MINVDQHSGQRDSSAFRALALARRFKDVIIRLMRSLDLTHVSNDLYRVEHVLEY
jgi:hypothetical protein